MNWVALAVSMDEAEGFGLLRASQLSLSDHQRQEL